MSKKFAYIRVSQMSSYGHQRLLIHRHFTCVLILCYFSWKLEKDPLMTVNEVRHSPFSYQIFAMQMKAAIQADCVQEHRLSAKKEHRHVYQSTFFLLSLCEWLMWQKRHTVFLLQKSPKGWWCFVEPFSIDKIFHVDLLFDPCSNNAKMKILKSSLPETVRTFEKSV